MTNKRTINNPIYLTKDSIRQSMINVAYDMEWDVIFHESSNLKILKKLGIGSNDYVEFFKIGDKSLKPEDEELNVDYYKGNYIMKLPDIIDLLEYIICQQNNIMGMTVNDYKVMKSLIEEQYKTFKTYIRYEDLALNRDSEVKEENTKIM